MRLTNVPSYLHASSLKAECSGLGELVVDVAYGGNFYAIVDRQDRFSDMADHSALDLVAWSRELRTALNDKCDFTHPQKPEISGLSHILWTGAPSHEEATARNAVFYGERAIDRSPCGTRDVGTHGAMGRAGGPRCW